MIPTILHIETATDVCSVALSRGAEVIGLKEEAGGNNHAKHLLPFVEEALKQGGCTVKDLDGVAVSVGPGSYTGLRIGVSTAKGIAYTAGIPVMAIGSARWRVSRREPKPHGREATTCNRRLSR